MVVENPMSRMMTVEKELTTPFGIALVCVNRVSVWLVPYTAMRLGVDLRRKDTYEEQDSLGVREAHPHLLLVKSLVLNSRLVAGNPFDSYHSLAVAQEPRV